MTPMHIHGSSHMLIHGASHDHEAISCRNHLKPNTSLQVKSYIIFFVALVVPILSLVAKYIDYKYCKHHEFMVVSINAWGCVLFLPLM